MSGTELLKRVFGVAGLMALLMGSSPIVARADGAPTCYDDQGNVIPDNNNQQVLQWKQSEPNNWQGRGNIEGTVLAVEADQTGHNHFIIQIGSDPRNDVVEVIYNYSFGDLPQINVGMDIEACGDFIQAFAQSGPYAPSPAGAIIHWVHGDPRQKHPDGFVMVNGTAYGFDYTNARGN